jgi:hypothetical protein
MVPRVACGRFKFNSKTVKMKNASNQGSNHRRGRGRNVGKRNPNQRGHNCESNGPAGKVRGTPQQVLEKYLSLARDAAVSGEHIEAEAYFQFAEHYHRITSVETGNSQAGNTQSGNNQANNTQPGNNQNNQHNQQQARQQNQNQQQPAPQPQQPVIVVPPAMPVTETEGVARDGNSKQPAGAPVDPVVLTPEIKVVEIQNVDSTTHEPDSVQNTESRPETEDGPKPKIASKPKSRKPRKVAEKPVADSQDTDDDPPIAEAG